MSESGHCRWWNPTGGAGAFRRAKELRPGLVRSLIGLACLAVVAGGCFEPPIRERLELRFLPSGGAEIELTVVHVPPLFGDDEDPVVRRLAEEERVLLEGWSPWRPRFEALGEPLLDGLSWEREEGRLRRYRRWASVDDPGSLAGFFADTPIFPSYQEGDGWAEVAVWVGGGSRATGEEIRRMEATVQDWSVRLAQYLEAATELWRYNERRPGRARATVGAIFADFLRESESLRELRPREEVLVRRLVDAMDPVVEVLEVPSGEARTLDEISRLVYDPFPARLVVEPGGAILEVEGFAVGPDGKATVPGLGLWAAFTALEGRWLAPDPLVAVVEYLGRDDDLPFDLESFLERSARFEDPPSEDEVRGAVEELLEPDPVYRVAWKRGP